MNLNKYIQHNEEEFERFNIRLYDDTKSTLVNRSKHILASIQVNLVSNARKIFWKNETDTTYSNYHTLHNKRFYTDGIRLIEKMGTNNKSKIFAKIRYNY